MKLYVCILCLFVCFINKNNCLCWCASRPFVPLSKWVNFIVLLNVSHWINYMENHPSKHRVNNILCLLFSMAETLLIVHFSYYHYALDCFQRQNSPNDWRWKIICDLKRYFSPKFLHLAQMGGFNRNIVPNFIVFFAFSSIKFDFPKTFITLRCGRRYKTLMINHFTTLSASTSIIHLLNYLISDTFPSILNQYLVWFNCLTTRIRYKFETIVIRLLTHEPIKRIAFYIYTPNKS